MTRKRAWLLFRLAGALVAAWVVLILGIGQVYVHGLIHPGCGRFSVPPTGYEDIRLVTGEGVRIRAWWRAPQNGVVVILLAGHGGSRDAMIPEADMLRRYGYGALALDSRSCAGQPATLGLREIDELGAGVRYAKLQAGVRKVAVLGFSAGAVTAIRGAARIPEVDAVIAEGNYYNMWGEIANTDAKPLSLGWQIEHTVGGLLWLEVGAWPPAVSPIDDLPRIAPRPVLLIHGEKEARRNHAQAQFAAAGEPKSFWLVPGVGHGGYYSAYPAEFEQRITGFLGDYLH